MPENTQANTFPVGGIAGQNIFNVYDAGQPVYVKALTSRFGLQFDPYWNWWSLMGREEPIAGNGTWYAYENNRYIRTLKVLANVADPGTGNDTTFQLDPSFIDANGRFYGRVTEVVTMPGTKVQARIVNINVVSTTVVYFTLRPVDVNSNIGALTAGQTIIITNGGKAAGTGQIKGVTTGYTKRDFMLQIFDESYSFEGPEATKAYWFDVFDQNGAAVPYSKVTDLSKQAMVRLNSKFNGAFLVGQKTTNPALTDVTPDGETNLVNMTQGVIPTIIQNGATVPIPHGTFAVTDLDDLPLYLREQGVDTDIALLAVGDYLRRDIENAGKAFIQGNGEILTAKSQNFFAQTNAKDKAIHLGFSEIYKNGMTFLLKTIDDWSDPVKFGAYGNEYRSSGFCVPLSSFKDPVTGAKLQNVCTRYVEKNGYSRRFESWMVKGAGGQPATYVTDVDVAKGYMRAHIGQQLLKMNQAIWIDGQ